MRDEGLGLGSLHKWAKEDSPMLYIDLMSKTKCDDDGITLDDFQKSGKTFEYDYVKRIFEKRCMKVMKPLCYLEDEGGELTIRKETTMKSAYANVHFTSKNKRSINTVQFIDSWLKDPMIRTYKTMDFLPPPLVCPDG